MHPVDEVVVLLGGEVPVAIHEAAVQAHACPILVIRCDSVPKVGTVPLLDLHYS